MRLVSNAASPTFGVRPVSRGNWSHGTRAVMEAVPEEPRKRYRAEVAEAMEQIRESNGFPRTFTSVFTRGTSG